MFGGCARRVLNWGLPLVAFAVGSAWAQGPKPDLARGQQIASQVCVACHGPDGNSPLPANPNLAAQHAEYIAAQLAAFKAANDPAGKAAKRPNAVMQGMAASLTDADMKALGHFYSAQKAKLGAARDKTLAAKGETLFRGGNAASGVPACAGCHAPNGIGIPSQYPRLAGQYADYTYAQLAAYKANQRTHAVMAPIASRLTDDEMKALADYIAGMR